MRNFTYYFGLILLLIQSVFADSWNISWLPSFGDGMHYRVLVNGDKVAGETAFTSLVIQANERDSVTVVAFNELGEADPSVPIILLRNAPKMHVVLEESDDLKTWESKIIYKSDKHFFRLRIQKE